MIVHVYAKSIYFMLYIVKEWGRKAWSGKERVWGGKVWSGVEKERDR